VTTTEAPAGGATPEDRDIFPVVAPASATNRSVWIFAVLLAGGAVILFATLNSRRQTLTAPATMFAPEATSGRIVAPPDLRIPADGVDPEFGLRPQLGPVIIAPAPQPTRLAPRTYYPPPPPRSYTPPPTTAPTYSPPDIPRGAIVYDSTAQSPAPAAPVVEKTADRVRATRLANPSLTIPQGTVIPAVLETALDSTRPGGVRALVSRDVKGFDGSRLLIPRGSRLYGEYTADLAAGQNRALIQWTRLIRPDGVTVALDSPASDPLGRAGVKGKVNSHFLERFGDALLQSVLDVGVGVASNAATSGTVVVALPGGGQQRVSAQPNQQVQRTLTVKHGTSVSVFVARDLDFSTVER